MKLITEFYENQLNTQTSRDELSKNICENSKALVSHKCPGLEESYHTMNCQALITTNEDRLSLIYEFDNTKERKLLFKKDCSVKFIHAYSSSI